MRYSSKNLESYGCDLDPIFSADDVKDVSESQHNGCAYTAFLLL